MNAIGNALDNNLIFCHNTLNLGLFLTERLNRRRNILLWQLNVSLCAFLFLRLLLCFSDCIVLFSLSVRYIDFNIVLFRLRFFAFVLAISGQVYLHLLRLCNALFVSLIVGKRIEQTDCNGGLSLVRHHIGLLCRVADKSHFGKHSRHRRLVEHKELSLFHATVGGLYRCFVLVLSELRKVKALVDIGILVHCKHNVALWRVGVEALILAVDLIAFFQQNICVLLLCHLHIGTAARKSHNISLHSRRNCGRM